MHVPWGRWSTDHYIAEKGNEIIFHPKEDNGGESEGMKLCINIHITDLVHLYCQACRGTHIMWPTIIYYYSYH